MNKNNFLSAFKWSYLAYIVPNLILPFFTIYIAQLLSPKDYGIFTINLIFVGLLNSFQTSGFRPFIIKEKDISQEQKSTLFFFSVFIGLFGYFILSLISPIISFFFNEPLIKETLPILGIVLVFNSLSIVQLSFLEKKLQFKKIFFIRILPLLCVLCVTLPFVLNGYGYKALIFGEIAKSLSLSLSYILFYKWFPSFTFNIKYCIESFHFGKWVSFETILEYLLPNLDKIIIGYFFNTNLLGVYAMARQVVNILFGFITAGITPVLMPLFKIYINDKKKFQNTLSEVFKNTIFINFSLLFFISLFSIQIFEFLLPEWSQLGLFIILISIGEACVRSINPSRDLFKLFNKPKIYPRNLVINNMISIILFPITCYYFALTGFFLVKILNDLLYFFLQYFSLNRLLKNQLSFYFKFLSSIVTINAIIFLINHSIIQFFSLKIDGFIHLIFNVILSLALFIFFHRSFNRVFFLRFIRTFKQIIVTNA
tara:strand:+ start:22556 stop:24004 length:1449 start_codon:yes stop_codon:yes gene_type:complete